MKPNVTQCHVCGSLDLESLPQAGAPFCLVSSDVQPVRGYAEFSICSQCLTVQKAITPAWRAMIDEVYAHYDINHQSQGAEPTIFDSARGSGPRSAVLLQNLLEHLLLAERGRLLDIGCSNGNLLKSFHKLRPAWKLSGAELVDQWRDSVLALPGVEAFYSGPAPAYRGKFDIISLSHVLEHVPDPAGFLKSIAEYLTPTGRLLVASPNLRQNPSDLIIADHCTHFDEESLGFVVRRAGLKPDLLSTTMLPKELVAVLSVPGARMADEAVPRGDATRREESKQRCFAFFDLLEQVRQAARSCRAEGKRLGVMGSSIAACWTMLELGGQIDFFVDEDEHRIGHSLLDKPIVGPADTPAGAIVFIPMSVAVAEKIMTRWQGRGIDFRYVAANQPR